LVPVFVRVAVPKSAPEALTYSVPAALEPFAVPGVRVRVPLRKRRATGIVVAVEATTELPADAVRPIDEVLDDAPLLPARLMALADFVAGYYRCPLGTTLAAMLPARLLRADAEEARLTPAGAAVDPATLEGDRRALLAVLQERQRVKVPALLAAAGLAGRAPVEELVEAGWIRLSRRRRDRAPQIEVAAVMLPDESLEALLERCARAPRQRQVLEWLATEGRPALASEVAAATGASPATLRTMVERRLLHRFSQRPARSPRWSLGGTGGRHQLTDEQAVAVDSVTAAVAAGGYAPFLLHGVTGSGKTEVYLRCLEAVLAAGRSGIVLVPEIGLTPAASGAVERRFGRAAAVLHSAQSDGERWAEWSRLRDGEARVVVGPRSALFAPLDDLGLIVVDEEHDGAYKQNEAPRYHARDLALVLGRDAGVPVLLCSATPSAESSALVDRGLAAKLSLSRRVAGNRLPEVELVDLRREPPEPGEQGRTLFSGRLKEVLTETLDRGEQAILLMQRRGWAPVLMCRDCGHRLDCPSCSVAMVVHRRSRGLRCHYCGRHQGLPRTCPSCGGELLDAVGAGTEKVAHHLARLFPGVASVILDRDTVRRRNGLEDALGAFAAGRARVLVGTQMVAKGHHFPRGHPDRGDLGRRPAQPPGLPIERAHLPAPDPGRGAGGPRRPAGAGRHPDLLPGPPGGALRPGPRRRRLPGRGAGLPPGLRLPARGAPRPGPLRVAHPQRRAARRRGRRRGRRPAARGGAPPGAGTGPHRADPRAVAMAAPGQRPQPRDPAHRPRAGRVTGAAEGGAPNHRRRPPQHPLSRGGIRPSDDDLRSRTG
jgi:primosomal protein N' (replication factor Y) (superfamily II helicase)